MIDGSSLSYEENVVLTKKVTKYAHKHNVSVEGELGVLAGCEDHIFSISSSYTNPLLAIDFFKKTNVDSLAISYGTKHGALKGENIKLRKEIVIATMENMLHNEVKGTLVSHGSSLVPPYIVKEINDLGGTVKGHGIPLDQLKEVIPFGISKINIDTDIRLATTRNLLEYFNTHKEKRENSKIYPLLIEKKDSFEYRYYLKNYINELTTNKNFNDELKEIAPLLFKAVKEIVLQASINFSSYGDAKNILNSIKD